MKPKYVCDHVGSKRCDPKCKHAKPHYPKRYHEGCDEAGECWGETDVRYKRVVCKEVKP